MKILRMLASVVSITSLLVVGGAVGSAAATPTHAHRYYVSTQGSDTNSGNSPASAFRHIQRCADVAAPGDRCVIMGGTYRETVTPARSGTATAPITFEPFEGAKVTLSGADPVTGWRPVPAAALPSLAQANDDPFLPQSPFATAVRAGHIYASHVTLNPGLAGNEIFYNGQRQIPAQWPWPGSDPLTPRIEIAQDGTTYTDTIADPNLTQPAGYWTGAKVYTEFWFISQTGSVASSKPGSLRLADLPDGGNCVGFDANNTRYYLFGQLKMLSHPGGWFYDTASHTLYLWAPNGEAPSRNSVEAKQRTDAFDLSHVSNIQLIGLHLVGSTIETGTVTSGTVLNGIDAQYVSDYQTLAVDPHPVETDVCQILTAGETTSGIVLQGHDNVIENSTIDGSAGNGVALLGHNNTVTNNVIHDVDAMGTYAAGINLTGHDQTVTHNTIYRTGRSGINVDWHVNGYASHDNRIAYNDVSGFNRLNLDSGAIYVCCNLDLSGSSIDHNWLHSPTPMPKVDPWAEAGLYLDGASGHALAYDNVSWDGYVNDSGPDSAPNLVPVGIKINGDGPETLYNNDGPVQGGYNPNVPNTIINNIGTVYQQSHPGECLDADTGGGGVDGTNVALWSCGSYPDESWQLNKNSDGSYTLANVLYPSECLAADTAGGGADGTNVQLWSCGSNTGSWQLTQKSDGSYTLANVLYPSECLATDIAGAGADGTNVQLWSCASVTDSWQLNNNSDGSYMLTDALYPGGVTPQPTISHNLASTIDPNYVAPTANNYQLRPQSPARNAGEFIPGITVGGTDPEPSLGAYQYGAPVWTAGCRGCTAAPHQ